MGQTKTRLLEGYSKFLKDARIKVPAAQWLIMGIGASVAALLAILVLVLVLHLPIPIIFSFVLFIVILDLVLGYPYLASMRRVNEIERGFPNALKQMADTLKAGGTYEFALRELATGEFGPLKEEIEAALRKLEEGENFESALRGIGENVNSRLVKRTITVIIDSVRSGAGLADILDDIADDLREMHRIKADRKAMVGMQTMFIIAAGSVVAPFIFGLTGALINMLIGAGSSVGGISADQMAEALVAKDAIVFLTQAYIFVEVLASSLMISVMAEGRLEKSILYMPLLLLVAYVCYFASYFFIGGVFQGLV